jgi:pyruvate/2-oxoglutarate dehydrogenase complex dihydrolipoamide acyltransferase (E2) component
MSEPPLVETSSQQGDKSEKAEKAEKTEEDAAPAAADNKGAPDAAGEPSSPILSPKDNPSADLRNMRRIIAEDPEWSLATVPMLKELCIKHIVDNFESKCSLMQ